MMKKKEILQRFEMLTNPEILMLPATAYDDYDLLDVVAHFEEQEDDRSIAVIELILRSPAHDEMVDYSDLFEDLVDYLQLAEDYSSALRWNYAWLVYLEQNRSGSDRFECLHRLAQTYLLSGDFNCGLAMFTRLLQKDTGCVQTYHWQSSALWEAGLNDLALEVVDRGLALPTEPESQELRELMEDLRQKILQSPEPLESVSMEELQPTFLDAFRAVLASPVKEQHDEDEMEPYLPTVTLLADIEPEGNHALYAEILSQGKVLVPELIRMVFDPGFEDTPAQRHAMALAQAMRESMSEEFAELSNWLDRTAGDWRAELLTGYMGKIGGYTTPELEEFAANPDHAKDLRTSALEALAERSEKCPHQRDKIVSFLRSLLIRSEAYQASEETFVGILINILLEMDACETYPEIKVAFDEDRVNPTEVTLEDVHDKWDLAPLPLPQNGEDGLNLFLECKSCGRVRLHFTRVILVDVGTLDVEEEKRLTRHSPFILDHEIVCPKCGATDQYELNALSQFALMIPRHPDTLSKALQENGDFKLKPDPRLYFFRGAALGREVHPFDGIEEYRWRIAKQPGDASLHLGLGNLLRFLLRYERALEEYRIAHDLAPDNTEIVLPLAMAEHDFGNREIARQLYEKVISLETKDPRSLLDAFRSLKSDAEEGAVLATALEGLEALKRGKHSPWEMPVYNIDGDPLPISRSLPSHGRDSGSPRKRKRR